MVFMSSAYNNNQQLSDYDLNILWNEYQTVFDRVMTRFRYSTAEENELVNSFLNNETFDSYLNSFSDGRRFYIREMENHIYATINDYLTSVQQQYAQPVTYGRGGNVGRPAPGPGSPVNRPSPVMQNNAFAQNAGGRFQSSNSAETSEPITYAALLAKKSAETPRPVQQMPPARVHSDPQESEVSIPKFEVVQIREDINEISKCVESKDSYKTTEHVRIDMTVDYKHPKIVQYSSVNINTPCISVVQAVRILKDQVPEMFDIPQRIIYMEYDQLHCEEIVGKETNIAESFRLLAEKATTVNNIDTFMTIMVPALTNLSGKHGIINTKLKNMFNMYLMTYFRNPNVPTVYHQISNWVDLNTLITKTSALMQPWTKADPKYDQLIWKFLYSSMMNVLHFNDPAGAHIPSEDMKNAGMFASVPKLQMSEGKHLLRDYGNMAPHTWKKLAAKIDQKYVLYKTKCKVFVTNLELDDIKGNSDSPLVVIPYVNSFNPIHIIAYAAMEKSDPEKEETLPLITVLEYDEQSDKIVNTMNQGALTGTGLIYF